MNGYEDLRQIKTRIQAVTNILLHEFIRKTLAFYENKSRDSKNCFLQEKNTECCSIPISKLCINIHICDLSIKGLA